MVVLHSGAPPGCVLIPLSNLYKRHNCAQWHVKLMEYVGAPLVGVLTENDDAHLFQPGHITQSSWVTQYYLNFNRDSVFPNSHPGDLINMPRNFGVRNMQGPVECISQLMIVKMCCVTSMQDKNKLRLLPSRCKWSPCGRKETFILGPFSSRHWMQNDSMREDLSISVSLCRWYLLLLLPFLPICIFVISIYVVWCLAFMRSCHVF